jgi:hypothetical protein
MHIRAAAIAAVAAVAACGGESEPPPPTELAPPAIRATCELADYAEQGVKHVESPPPRGSYNSFPPTSGPHADFPVKWGAYAEPQEQYRLVHNLEHGGVVIQYGADVSHDVVGRLLAWYGGDPNAIVIAPLPELADKIAVTAWTRLLTCDGFDEPTFTEFRDAYRYQGPERFPPEDLEPGE